MISGITKHNLMKRLTQAASLTALSIPDEPNTLSAEDTAADARAVGMEAGIADRALEAIRAIVAEDPHARILICGSLYLAGSILRENG